MDARRGTLSGVRVRDSELARMTEKVPRGKRGRQIDQVAVARQLNQYNLSTPVSPRRCDSPALEVGSALGFSYPAPPQLLELPAD